MKSKDIFMFALGALIVLGFFATLYILAFVEISQNNKDLFNIALGAEIVSFTSIVQYFYGSSKGSSDKTVLLSQAEAIKPPTQ